MAVAQSPAVSAARMRLDETGPAGSATASTACVASPAAAPSAASTATLPPRPLPKVKSRPVTTAAAPACADEPLLDELLGGLGRQLAVEAEHQHRIGARRRQQPRALIERGQAERRRIGAEEADRMRIEGRDDQRAAGLAGERLRPRHHRLVAPVEPVEIAQRHHAAAQMIGQSPVARQPLHEAGL